MSSIFIKKKLRAKKETINFLSKEFGVTLDRIISYKNVNNQLWPLSLKNINNKKIIENSHIKEKKLLLKKPEIVMNKMLKVSGGMYWHTLGKEKYIIALTFYLIDC